MFVHELKCIRADVYKDEQKFTTKKSFWHKCWVVFPKREPFCNTTSNAGLPYTLIYQDLS